MDWILPPLSWEHLVRLSSSPLLKKQSVPSSLCRRTCSSSFIHPPPSIGFLAFFSFCHGRHQPQWRGRGFGLRKVTFATPASWGKVNHNPPVFVFGVSWGSHLSFVWVPFFFCLFCLEGGGIRVITHLCFVEPIAWIMLDAKAAAVTSTTFFLKYSPSLLSSSEPHGTLNWSYCVGRGWGWVEETVNSS